METYIHFGRNYIDKLDLIKAFKPARMAVLNASNIYSGFAITELILYNPQKILSRLYYKLRTSIFFKTKNDYNNRLYIQNILHCGLSGSEVYYD